MRVPLDPRDDYCRSASVYCGTLVFTRPELCVTTRGTNTSRRVVGGKDGAGESRETQSVRIIFVWLGRREGRASEWSLERARHERGAVRARAVSEAA